MLRERLATSRHSRPVPRGVPSQAVLTVPSRSGARSTQRRRLRPFTELLVSGKRRSRRRVPDTEGGIVYLNAACMARPGHSRQRAAAGVAIGSRLDQARCRAERGRRRHRESGRGHTKWRWRARRGTSPAGAAAASALCRDPHGWPARNCGRSANRLLSDACQIPACGAAAAAPAHHRIPASHHIPGAVLLALSCASLTGSDCHGPGDRRRDEWWLGRGL